MNVTKSRVIIGSCSLAVLLLALIFGGELIPMLLIFVFTLVALVVLYKDIPNLSNVSEDNPKAKTLRNATLFSIGSLVILIPIFVLFEKGVIQLTPQQEVFVLPIIFAALIIGFGNIAPKLPCNRYTGLRLPWTVYDEESWIIAHRLLGRLSLPCGILCFAGVGSLERGAFISVTMALLWMGIPSVVSYIYFYRKWHPKT